MTNNLHTTHILVGLLIFLIILSAFFSAAETAMMSLNRYRLRNLVRKNHRAAKYASELLERPDLLLSVILIGDNCADIFASSVATLLVLQQFGHAAVAFSTLVLTLIILIFAEIAPKTWAAMYPERVAFASVYILKFLLVVLYPVIWLINGASNLVLRVFGVKVSRKSLEKLNHEELRTVLREATGLTVTSYQGMLLSILDLEAKTVEDIMIPRQDILGIDLDEDWNLILQNLTKSQHTRIPLYSDSIDHVKGMLHLRHALNLMAKDRLNKKTLLEIADPVYFVPEGTPLNVQLGNFKKQRCRSALVVDEYGDILGLITLEDILEEIVGEFTTSLDVATQDVQKQKDDSYLVDGSVNIRELNRLAHTDLPIEGPKTLNGLILEYLETLPIVGIGFRLSGYPIEIIAVEENMVKTAKIWPKARLLLGDLKKNIKAEKKPKRK